MHTQLYILTLAQCTYCVFTNYFRKPTTFFSLLLIDHVNIYHFKACCFLFVPYPGGWTYRKAEWLSIKLMKSECFCQPGSPRGDSHRSRRHWLQSNQPLLRMFLSYCSLHGSHGGGLASVRMELILLLQESHQVIKMATFLSVGAVLSVNEWTIVILFFLGGGIWYEMFSWLQHNYNSGDSEEDFLMLFSLILRLSACLELNMKQFFAHWLLVLVFMDLKVTKVIALKFSNTAMFLSL